MPEATAPIAEADGQGDFVVLGIFFSVPQVVEVEDGGGQESGTQGRSPIGGGEGHTVQGPDAGIGHRSKEEDDGDLTESPVTVGATAHGVADRGGHREESQSQPQSIGLGSALEVAQQGQTAGQGGGGGD